MWKLAWRNLWRNRTRSIITGSAISLTLMLMLFTFGIQDSMYGKMSLAAIRSVGGDVLVHADGYWASPSIEARVTNASRTLSAAQATEGVQVAVPRVIVQGLLSSANGNAPIRLMGIDPVREAVIQDHARYLSKGTFLEETGGRRIPLVLGAEQAKDLHAEMGDRLVLTSTDPEGEMAYALFYLSGILETGSASSDRAAAFTTIKALRKALNLGASLSQIGIMFDQGAAPAIVRQRILDSFKSASPPLDGLEVLTWKEAIPEMVAFIEIDKKTGEAMLWVVFIIVAFAIMNTFMMAVMERIRELGLLSALGLSPGKIAQLVLCETTLLALLSTALGLILGLGAHWLTDTYGIDMANSMPEDFEMAGVVLDDMVLRSQIDLQRWVGAIAGVFMLVLLSGCYPAFKATRLSPTDAMRTYE